MPDNQIKKKVEPSKYEIAMLLFGAIAIAIILAYRSFPGIADYQSAVTYTLAVVSLFFAGLFCVAYFHRSKSWTLFKKITGWLCVILIILGIFVVGAGVNRHPRGIRYFKPVLAYYFPEEQMINIQKVVEPVFNVGVLVVFLCGVYSLKQKNT